MEATAVNPQDLPRIRSDRYQDIYSNFVTANLGAYDLTLIFGRIKQAADGPGLVNEEQASVTLSPIQFKLLADLCARITAAYEQGIAPITLPAQDTGPKLTVEQMLQRITAVVQPKAVSTEQSQPSPQPASAGKGSKKKP